MSVICQCVDGAFLDHNLYVQSYLKCDIKNTGYKLKDEFFSVDSPFMMESQAERLRREANCSQLGLKAVTKETSADRKRRKKRSKQMSQETRQIDDFINKSLVTLITQAREINNIKTFSLQWQISNNDIARKASLIEGFGDVFQTLCERFDEALQDYEESATVFLREGLSLFAASVINRCVTNSGSDYILCKFEDNNLIIPGQCSFLTSSFQHFITRGHLLITVEGGYDLIVIDPPWTNKSVKRKKSYLMIEEEDLKKIPIGGLAKDNCLVCVWVTNNQSLHQFVRDELFPHWSVRWAANWIWVKVTRFGEPVCQINSQHKKPYEQIIIGRVQRSRQNLSDVNCGENNKTGKIDDSSCPLQNVNLCAESETELLLNVGNDCVKGGNHNAQDIKQTCSVVAPVSSTCHPTVDPGNPRLKSHLSRNQVASDSCAKEKTTLTDSCTKEQTTLYIPSLEIPPSFVLASVPCSLHSKKPPLSDILMPYLPLASKNLELFARNLTEGWCSWGNEPLRHQHLDYYEISSLRNLNN